MQNPAEPPALCMSSLPPSLLLRQPGPASQPSTSATQYAPAPSGGPLHPHSLQLPGRPDLRRRRHGKVTPSTVPSPLSSWRPSQPWQVPAIWTCPVNPHLMNISCNIIIIIMEAITKGASGGGGYTRRSPAWPATRWPPSSIYRTRLSAVQMGRGTWSC
jgi:hypothetical protein